MSSALDPGEAAQEQLEQPGDQPWGKGTLARTLKGGLGGRMGLAGNDCA